MKKVFWLIIAAGILAVLLVMWAIVSMVSNMSFGIGISFGGLGIWLALAMVGVWAYLKHKKSGLASITGWVAIALLLFVWLGPTRSNQIAQGTGVVLDSVADSVTSVVTTGNIKTPAQIAAARKAEVEEAKHQADLKAAAIVPPPARTEAIIVRKDCGGKYAELTNCRSVRFGANEIYYTEVQPTINEVTKQEELWCTFADPVDAGYWEHIGGRQFAFTPYSDNVVRVTFFEVKQGEKAFGVVCP